MLEKEQDRVWEQLDEYLLSVRDDNGTPLAAWTRATKKIFPKVAAEDNPSNYITRDSELVERALIVQERYCGQTNTALEATCLMRTEVFKEGNLILFAKLQQMLGGLGIWEMPRRPRGSATGGTPTLRFPMLSSEITLCSSGQKPIARISKALLTTSKLSGQATDHRFSTAKESR